MKKILFFLIPLIFLFVGCGAKLVEDSSLEKFDEPGHEDIIVVSIEGAVSIEWVPVFEQAFSSKNCGAVLAVINSPGGGVTETKLVTHALKKLKEIYRKPLYIYSDRGIYSGAYWISTVADKIIVAPSTMTGSVGVFSLRLDITKYDSLIGLKVHVFSSGKNKTTYLPYDTLTQSQREQIQYTIDYLYNEFLSQILNTRGRLIYNKIEKIIGHQPNPFEVLSYLKEVCDGRELFSEEALNFGLIDYSMYYDELISSLQMSYPKFQIKSLDGSNARVKIPKAIKFEEKEQSMEMIFLINQ